jgi:preprotein translocase subunit SecA
LLSKYSFLIKDIADEQERALKADEIRQKAEEDKKAVIEAGGLYILGTERHESRRIDNQLRGRSGRQGDPGYSKFFLSMEDDLLRIFGGEKLGDMMGKLGLKEDEAVVHPWISSSVEKAQKKVENAHYETRKNVLKYDDVVNEQRLIIFEQRMDIIKASDVSEEIKYLQEQKNSEFIEKFLPERSSREQWELDKLKLELERIYGGSFEIEIDTTKTEINEQINKRTAELYKNKENAYGELLMRQVERQVFLITIDKYWKEHLRNLDALRQGIGYRAYAQKDPLMEYKKEAFVLFESLLYNMNEEILNRLFHVVINVEGLQQMQAKMEARPVVKAPTKDNGEKISRNDLCPCGSGKKYKHCCGKES